VDGGRTVRAETNGGKSRDTERERKKKLVVERAGQEQKSTGGSIKKSSNKTPLKRKRIVLAAEKPKIVEEESQEEEEQEEEEEEAEMSQAIDGSEEEEEDKKPRVIQRAPGRVLAITIRNADSQQVKRDDGEVQEEVPSEEHESEGEILEESEEEPAPPSRGHRRTAVLSTTLLSDSEEQSSSDSESPRWKASSRESSRSRSHSLPSRTIKVTATQADKEEILRAKLPTTSNGKDERIRLKVAEKVSERTIVGKTTADKSNQTEELTDPVEELEEEHELRAVVVSHERALAKFMRTKSRPHVFFAPATPCSKSRAWQAKCEKNALERIASLEKV
jgi:hypothetical protein